jgi:magnesium chelatase subunit I
VKEELRANLLARLRSRKPVFPDIIGFEDSVAPALERAILAGHDVIMLGERGQAKSRLMRHLVELLDESAPIVEGSELNDHPYHPVSAMARNLVAELGDATPISRHPTPRSQTSSATSTRFAWPRVVTSVTR